MNLVATPLDAGLVLLSIHGPLDVHTYGELDRTIAGILQSGVRKLVVDLSGVNLVDGLGLGSFIEALGAVREKGGDLILIRPNESVKEVFALMGLETVFPFRGSVEEAAAVLKGPS